MRPLGLRESASTGWPDEVVEAKLSVTSLPSSSSSIAAVRCVGHTEEQRARELMLFVGFCRGGRRREVPVVMEVADQAARGGDNSNSGAGGYRGDGLSFREERRGEKKE